MSERRVGRGTKPTVPKANAGTKVVIVFKIKYNELLWINEFKNDAFDRGLKWLKDVSTTNCFG